MFIATFIMINVQINVNLSKAEIEKRAREYGMEYKGEHKVIESDTSKETVGDVKKW